MTSAETKRQTLIPQNQPGTSLLLSTVGPPVPPLCLRHREPGGLLRAPTPNPPGDRSEDRMSPLSHLRLERPQPGRAMGPAWCGPNGRSC